MPKEKKPKQSTWYEEGSPAHALGLEPTFWTFETKEPIAPRLLENII